MIDLLIIFAAKYLIALPVVVLLYYGYTTPNRTQFIRFTLACGAMAFILSLIASALYYNPRPFMITGIPPLVAHGPGNGFPSDHALLAGTIAAVVTAFNPYVGAFLWLVAVAVGAGRMLAGVHHDIDIATSFGIAIMSALVLRYYLYTKRSRESSQS